MNLMEMTLVATACMSKEFVVMIVVGRMLLHMLAPQHLKVDLVMHRQTEATKRIDTHLMGSDDGFVDHFIMNFQF
jgi:hypothetical protein